MDKLAIGGLLVPWSFRHIQLAAIPFFANFAPRWWSPPTGDYATANNGDLVGDPVGMVTIALNGRINDSSLGG